MRLIVTRPAAQAADAVAALQQQGVQAVALPLIDIAPLADTSALREAWAGLHTLSFVMFVSANAVAHFMAERPAGLAWPQGVRAGSTGPGTTAALLAAGVPEDAIVQPAPDAPSMDSEALWARLSGEPWAGRRVLVVRGEEGRDWLATQWQSQGAELTFLAAYRRLPPRLDAAGLALLAQAQAEPAQHVWLFSSSEAIGHLRALVPQADWSRARALATHPRIVQAARDAGFGTVLEVAAGEAAVVQALKHASIQSAPPVNDTTTSPPLVPVPAPATPGAEPVIPLPQAAAGWQGRWLTLGLAVLAALGTAALMLAWNTQQRVKALEAELVKRQQDSGVQATEAKVAARQAQDLSRESAAKLALLEARVAETTLQRSQLEDLIQSLARSRDENVLADLEAAIRVALQQAAITGSAEPLVLTLKQADDRLARINQPRLERVRRAVAQDLDRVRSAGVTDISVLTIRLDEAIRLVDELPLLAGFERRSAMRPPAPAPAPASSAASSAGDWREASRNAIDYVWQEVRSLVRVTRIDQPEAMLVAPEQAFFLRENLKLRLLNARLALLSRQFDTAQSDLRDAQAALDRYFDRGSRRVSAAADQVRQVAAQARLVNVPRPDATLAAIAAASAGR